MPLQVRAGVLSAHPLSAAATLAAPLAVIDTNGAPRVCALARFRCRRTGALMTDVLLAAINARVLTKCASCTHRSAEIACNSTQHVVSSPSTIWMSSGIRSPHASSTTVSTAVLCALVCICAACDCIRIPPLFKSSSIPSISLRLLLR